MIWQTLLAKIGLCEPPVPDLVRASADRFGVVNRRAFLQLAGAAVAGLAIDPERLLWVPGEKVSVTIVDSCDLHWLTRDMARRLQKELNYVNSSIAEHVCLVDTNFPLRLGDCVAVREPSRFPGPVGLNMRTVPLDQQLNVERRLDEDYRIDPSRHLQPMADLLAHNIQHKRLNLFAPLHLPKECDEAVVVSDEATGFALRGIKHRQLDVTTGESWTTIRFDILGGRA